jgi:hypothetical protein
MENKSMNINLSTYAVRDAAGNVNMESTVEKFSADLETFVAARETESEVISNAVNAVFDDLNGTRANVPYIVSMSLQKLNVAQHPAQFKTLSERVHSYLTANSQGKTTNGVEERPNSLFIIGRGRGNGGVQRRADLAASSK